MSEQFDVILGGLDTEVDVTIADSTGVDPSVLLALRGEKGDTGAAGQDGTDGADGIGIADISKTGTVDNVDTYTITYSNGDATTFNVTNGIDGVDGVDGQDGTDGADGFSPIATVSKVGDTATISITDLNGTTTANISDGTDGQDGRDGVDGQDGYTPIKGVDYFDGQDGQDGADGQDGFSPIATVTKSGDTATISITDANGTTTATVTDGADGQDGSIVSINRKTSSGTNIADITIDGVTTELYAPNGGGGTITDVEVDGTSVVTGGVAEIDLTGKSDVGHTHTKSAITDFPTTVSSFTNDAGYITGVTSTDTPTADTIAEFDASAHMNSTDMTSQEVSDFVDGLDAQGANLADYIIEKGTSGEWNYQKWNSGKVEALYSHSWGSQSGSIWVSPIYCKDLSITIPSGIFSNAPTAVFITGNDQWVGWGVRSVTATGMTARFVTLAAGSQSLTGNLYAIYEP